MPKFFATLLVIYSLLIVILSAPVHAQPTEPTESKTSENVPVKPQPDSTNEAGRTKKPADIRRVIDDENRKFEARSAEFDPVKHELEKAKQARKGGWSKTEKTMAVLFAVGITVLVIFLIKYGKNCLETSPPNCNIGNDDNCYCERYEEEGRGRGSAK